MAKTYKWIVEVEVHERWVADGFDLDDERATQMLSKELPHAIMDREIWAKVLKAPAAAEIRKEQGYKD